MKLRQILIIAGCILAFIVFPVSADSMSAPELPAQFSGTLYNHEGKPFPAGTVIVAEVNGVTSTFTLTEAGKIGGPGAFDDKFLISGATAGSEITFKIQGTDVTVKQTYNPGSSLKVEQLQLTIPVDIPNPTPVNPQPVGPVVTPTAVPSVIPTENPTIPADPGSEGEVIPTGNVPVNPTAPGKAASPFPLAAVLFGLAGVGFCIRRR